MYVSQIIYAVSRFKHNMTTIPYFTIAKISIFAKLMFEYISIYLRRLRHILKRINQTIYWILEKIQPK